MGKKATGRMAASGSSYGWVALLRGVNVGGHRRVPMAELRELATALGWGSVQTYVQSGNLVFRAAGKAAALGAALEGAIVERFGFEVPVAVRSAAEWARLATGGVFPAAEAARPKALHVGLTAGEAAAPKASLVTALAPYCTRGETVVLAHGAVWIDFMDGVAGTKITPAVLDRLAGAPLTLRNWNTVLAVQELLHAT